MRWLPDKDLNLDKQIQSLLCYRYTIGQTSASKLEYSRAESSRAMKDHGFVDRWMNGLRGPTNKGAESCRRLRIQKSTSTNPSIHQSIYPPLR
jgi:hypothetical protein